MNTKPVSEEMTKNLVTIRDTEKMAEAYRLMFANKIRHLPVLDRDGDLCGIVSDRDIQRAMQSDVSDSFGFKMESIQFKDEAKVSDYMTWPVQTFEFDTDVKVVLQAMLDKKVSAFLITKSDEVHGIVTTDDFLRLLKHMLTVADDERSVILGDLLTSPLFGRMANMISNVGI